MKSQFKISGMLMAAVLLFGILALPTAAAPQTPDSSNASLADTLTWLKSFLPPATGATASGPSFKDKGTSSITTVDGCNLAIVGDNSQLTTAEPGMVYLEADAYKSTRPSGSGDPARH
jgi:hypothetical protein